MEMIRFQDTELLVRVDDGLDGQKDVWLDQEWMAKLFWVNRPAITKHVQNIYKNDEVDRDTYRSYDVVTEKNGKKYRKSKNEYNLDVILSVGYRVNGKKGVEFRRWANDVLGKYLRKGYVVNEKVLMAKGLDEVVWILENINRSIRSGRLASPDEMSEITEMLRDYGYSLTTLQEYDEDRLVLTGKEKRLIWRPDYEKVSKYIAELKKELVRKGEATELFGQEKPGNGISLGGILGNVFQTLFGEDAYPSVEEKASHILYFIIKDHPFNDGNKRIAAFLFSLFLKKNDFAWKKDGTLKINDTALASLAILVAESNPKQKEQYIKLLVNALRAR